VTGETQRLDKWLWCARFFKTRALAAQACSEGRLRLAGRVIQKAHHSVKPGDVLTFPLGPHIRVIRIMALGLRRGPAPEARTLYEDLAPPPSRDAGSQAMPASLGQGSAASGDGTAEDDDASE
jgi:ribosome-associated heat shock protein Hsp15